MIHLSWFYFFKHHLFSQKGWTTITTNLYEHLIRKAQMEFLSKAFLLNKYMKFAKD